MAEKLLNKDYGTDHEVGPVVFVSCVLIFERPATISALFMALSHKAKY